MSDIAIIDLDSVAYTIFHPNKVLDDAGIPLRENSKFVYVDKTEDEIIQSCDEVMTSILNTSKCKGYIAYIKGKNTTSSRKVVYPEYKANRNTEQPKHWEFVKELLISKWGAIEVNNIEVDDAVNITRLDINKTFGDSFICALDKDLLSLEGTHYNWRTEKWVIIDKINADRLFWTDMVTGQTGDNIKGIPGCGIKYVEKLFNTELVEVGIKTYGSTVFESYIENFGEYKGIQEFHKNYISLKILEQYQGFVIPKIINYNSKVEELF